MTRPLRWWVAQGVPFAVILGLLTAAFSFELAAVGTVVVENPLGRRDRMYAITAGPATGYLVMAGAGGKIVVSADLGAKWVVSRSGTTANLQDLVSLGGRRLVAAGNAGTFLYSADGGNNWKVAKSPPADDIVKVMALAVQPGGGAPWAVAHYGAILTSPDRGETWERVSPKEDVIWNDIAFATPQVGWVVGEFGRIMKSVDAGKTWRSMPSPVKSSLSAVAFVDESKGVMVGTEGAILVTRDGGASWDAIKPVVKDHLYDVTVAGEGWIATGNNGALLAGGFDSTPPKRIEAAGIGNAWHTKVVAAGERLFLAGAVSGIVEKNKFEAFR